MLTRLIAILVGLGIGLTATAPSAHAGTYAFSLPEAAIRLGAPEPGSHPAFAVAGSNGIGMAAPAVAFPAGAFARRWITLPGGAVFSSLSGHVRSGSGNVAPGPLRTAILLRQPNAAVATPLLLPIAPGSSTSAWAAPAAFYPYAVRLSLDATGAGSCATCSTALVALSGSIDDNQAPTATTVTSPLAGKPIGMRSVPITWSTTDVAAGPGNVFAEINGVRAASPLRTAPTADAGRLTGQRSAGQATVIGSATLTLPDVDGSYQLRVTALDAVGNQTTSAPITVALDRQPPSVGLTTASGWCATTCPVTIAASDPSGVAAVSADLNGIPVTLDSIPTPVADVSLTFDAIAAGIQGSVALHVRAIDRVGNVSDRNTTLTIDSTPPALDAPDADPLRRRVEVGVTELSGVRTARVSIAGATIPLGSVGGTDGGLQRFVATIAPTVVAGDLDGQTATIEVVDAAGNVATQSVAFRTRAATTIAGIASHRSVTGRRFVAITGVVQAGGVPADLPMVVTLENPNWPRHTQRWRARPAEGRYALRIRPRMSGTLRIRFAGDAANRPATTTIGRVAVHPKITADFRFVRRGGEIVGLRVRGRMRPAGGPGAALVWQARAPRRIRLVHNLPGRRPGAGASRPSRGRLSHAGSASRAPLPRRVPPRAWGGLRPR